MMRYGFIFLTTTSVVFASTHSPSTSVSNLNEKLATGGAAASGTQSSNSAQLFPVLPAPEQAPVGSTSYLQTVHSPPPYDLAGNVPENSQPSVGETSVCEHADSEGNVVTSVKYGKTQAMLGDAWTYATTANPMLAGAQYKAPGSSPSARDLQRSQALETWESWTGLTGSTYQSKKFKQPQKFQPHRGSRLRKRQSAPADLASIENAVATMGGVSTLALKVSEADAKERIRLNKNALTGQMSGYVQYADNSGVSEHQAVPEVGVPVSGWTQPTTLDVTSEGHPVPMISRIFNGKALTILQKSAPISGGKGHRKVAHVRRQDMETGPPLAAIQNAANNTGAMTAAFGTYLSTFQTTQSHVSRTIFPFLDAMTNTSNSSLVYNAAWSIYSDLTGTSPYVIGPFSYGMNCLEYIEDQLMSSNNMTDTNNPTVVAMFAVNKVLIDLYNGAWRNATAALNATGMVDDMIALSESLAPVDQSILPAGYSTHQAHSYNNAFFTDCNRSIG